jgi:hypothetical protein
LYLLRLRLLHEQARLDDFARRSERVRWQRLRRLICRGVRDAFVCLGVVLPGIVTARHLLRLPAFLLLAVVFPGVDQNGLR